MKTAMQILYEKYGYLLPDISEDLETEKKQIIEAYDNGYEREFHSSENYYNETFKNE